MTKVTQEARAAAAELCAFIRGTYPLTPSLGPITRMQREMLHEAADMLAALQPASGMEDRIAELERERDEAMAALERDRTTVAGHVAAIKRCMAGYSWLREAGRGPYAYNDDRYQEEFGNALDTMEAGLRTLSKIAADWTNCPKGADAIAAARMDWQARALKAEAERDEARAKALSRAAEIADGWAASDYDESANCMAHNISSDIRAEIGSPCDGLRGTLQARVQPWMMECFGPTISAARVERGDRLLEEVFELLQSGGYDFSRIASLAAYVWGRPPGEPSQEVGGVMVTLAAYCLAHGLDMHEAGEVELARILQPGIVEKIRAKQAAKARDIPFSPLPDVEREVLTPEGLSCLSQKVGAELLTYVGHAAMGGLKDHEIKRMEWLKALSEKLSALADQAAIRAEASGTGGGSEG